MTQNLRRRYSTRSRHPTPVSVWKYCGFAGSFSSFLAELGHVHSQGRTLSQGETGVNAIVQHLNLGPCGMNSFSGGMNTNPGSMDSVPADGNSFPGRMNPFRDGMNSANADANSFIPLPNRS